MTTARPFYEQSSKLPVASPQKDWPTMYDLPSEDQQKPGLPDEFHDLQPQLLSATLQLTTIRKEQVFTGSDLNLYYDRDHPSWYKRPDWFAVAGVPRLYNETDLRLSYVTWDEKVVPFIVVELISPGTAMSDLGELEQEQNGMPTKWQVYEQILKVPNYVVFDRYKDKLWCFKLMEGQYQKQDIRDRRFWLADMGIGLGVWQGEYEGITRSWLRWYDLDGVWILNKDEKLAEERSQRQDAERQAEQERSQRQDAERQVEQERSRAKRLAERLKALGIDPDKV